MTECTCGFKDVPLETIADHVSCDYCEEYMKCMSAADDSWGEAWSNFEKANPNKKCTTCMDCGEWVALEEITESDSCPHCGGCLDGDEDDLEEPANG